jgi:hypothetical protein
MTTPTADPLLLRLDISTTVRQAQRDLLQLVTTLPARDYAAVAVFLDHAEAALAHARQQLARLTLVPET